MARQTFVARFLDTEEPHIQHRKPLEAWAKAEVYHSKGEYDVEVDVDKYYCRAEVVGNEKPGEIESQGKDHKEEQAQTCSHIDAEIGGVLVRAEVRTQVLGQQTVEVVEGIRRAVYRDGDSIRALWDFAANQAEEGTSQAAERAEAGVATCSELEVVEVTQLNYYYALDVAEAQAGKRDGQAGPN